MRVQLVIILCKKNGVLDKVSSPHLKGIHKKDDFKYTNDMYIQANRDIVSLMSSDYRHVITNVSQTYVKITFQ